VLMPGAVGDQIGDALGEGQFVHRGRPMARA
jgi:hypothetical protein